LHNKYNITLVLMNDTIFYEIPENVELVFLEKSKPDESGIKKLLKLPYLGWKYKNFLKKEKIDISLSLMTRPNYINIFAKLFGSGAKTIISERSNFSMQYGYKNLQSFINKMLVGLYNYADLIVANAKGNKQDLIENFHIKTPVITIYNALDMEDIDRKKEESIEIEKKRFTFVTIGRMDVGKNHILLIESVKEIDADLWIIGDGELRGFLEKKVLEYNLQDRVLFLGRQSNPYRFLNRADCFVFGSNHEGFPNVLLEALACELPVISTDCLSGPREILAPNTEYKNIKDIEIAEYGILVPVNNEEKLAKAMKLIYEDNELRYNFRNKAKNRAKEFEVKRIIKEWEKIIKKSYNG
jgi:N-acetylgalactosamine-N,N'-diacetylbacillosaminyl-diphospho-undecaprenol 4-alpha-N-acetylgalactosaminyltransferase